LEARLEQYTGSEEVRTKRKIAIAIIMEDGKNDLNRTPQER
jgi:hypothetical protein